LQPEFYSYLKNFILTSRILFLVQEFFLRADFFQNKLKRKKKLFTSFFFLEQDFFLLTLRKKFFLQVFFLKLVEKILAPRKNIMSQE